MQEQIVINEVGAFIPRTLFGHKEQIVTELAHAGVFALAEVAPPPPQIRRVPPIDLSRELQWLKEHRHEYLEQWVALEGDQLIAHGSQAREVYAAARAAGIKSPFVEFISTSDELPFGGW
ncbi:MAG: hypothetical protein HOP19_06710 [Acidobacteria bacterium]|nr:hypothetical protein [Acidobacteriota bacterium]